MTGAAPGLGGGGNLRCQEGPVESEGEGEAQVPQHAPSKVGSDRRHVRVEELIEGVDCVEHRFAVDRWNLGFFKALDKIINGNGRHVGGGNN